ncbi:MAG: cellulase family glycosylhydrolase [Prevotella sp.]|nr:cellulase family glycosylhydrolase [Prevotella sp.]
MKRILNLLVLLMVMTSSTSAAENISLSVSDMQFDWGGWGGSADATENSITFPNWANNYWTVSDLSTDEYTRLDMVFAQPVNYYRMVVKAVYSDESETESVISYGATSHSLIFENNKTLVKIVMLQGDWEGLNKVNGEDVTAKIYFESITIVGSGGGGTEDPDIYEDVSLSVADMQLSWDGTKDVSENSCTFGDIWSENYWTIGNLDTSVYTRIDMTFAQPMNYYKVKVKAVYSDNSETDTEVTYGAQSHSVKLTAGKKLVKIAMKQFDQKNLNGGAKVVVYFDNIIIRTKESAAAVTPKTWTSSFKLGTDRANPLLDFHYVADPTAIEYNGRLYVYGTNDHQQYESGTPTNSYEAINSLVVISTDDMVNWTYHGLIDTKAVAPWIMASWAPSIISKPQADGSTLFSLYFSNSGTGSGVIQSTSPLGPWESPLNQNLTGGFDPGAVIDANGDGWLAYGTGESYIVKLGDDLHTVAEGPIKLTAPYYFEANELNYIGGKYVHTYNNDWSSHEPWIYGGEKPTSCSMNYFTTTTPLDADSWMYGANYFKNTGENGMNYGNNHTHLHKYQGKWYLFYQSNDLEPSLGTNGGFRSLFVDEIEVDEEDVIISECIPTFTGVSAIKNLDPYTQQYAATCAATLGIVFEQADGNGHTVAKVGSPNMTAEAPTEGIIEVRNVDFSTGLGSLKMLIKGSGSISLRLDNKNGADLLTISSTGDSWNTMTANYDGAVAGVHTVFFVLTGSVLFDTWQAVTSSTAPDNFEKASEAVGNMKIGWNLGNTLDAFNGTSQGLNSETCWGQPKTKPELFSMFKDAGFGAIRVPVTWNNHMDSNGKVDEAWMARVKEVVDYVINAGMYCILNVHHDTGTDAWIVADMDNYTANKSKFEYLWQQIATEFRDYDEHLLFEGYNEMLDANNSWSYASSKNSGSYDATAAASAYNAVNSYAQSFVNTVRATGGNNAVRNLIVNTYAACCGMGTWNSHLQDPLTQMQLPTDAAAGHLIFEVHSYPSLNSGLSSAKSSIDQMMTAVETNLASKGAPVIFGEWGVPDDEKEKDYTEKNADMLAFAQYFVEQAKAKGFGTFYWMGLSDGQHRSVPEFNQSDLKDAICRGYYGEVSTSGSTLFFDNPSTAIDHYYDLQGRQYQRPMKGLNIVRMSDGSVRKVIKH